MVVLLIILFTLLLLGSLFVSKNDIFSPGVITTVIWIFCLLLYLVLEHNLPPLTGQFLGAVSLWVFFYVFSAMFIQTAKFSTGFNYEPSKLVLDIYFFLSVATFPLLLLFAYNAISIGTSGNWALDLRYAALGQSSNTSEIYEAPYFIIWNASYLIELFYYSEKNKNRVYLLAFFILSYAFFTMSKYSFLDFFLRTVCVLYLTKRVSIKHLLIGLACLFVLFMGLQTLRHSVDMSTITAKEDFLVLYLVGNMSAFDTLQPASSIHFGENTFRVLYAVFYKLGISDIPPVESILKWITKPLSTNTYTGMYPFFKDFGYWGIGIFASFFGFLFGWLFKKAKQGNTIFILLYSFFITIIVAQYVGDVFFAGISGHIKAAIVLIIPFLATKYKWFYSKNN
jgi:oligosaccharide repeat unit polymerase